MRNRSAERRLSRRDILGVLAVGAAASGAGHPTAALAVEPLRIGVVKVPQWAAAWLAPEMMPTASQGRLIEFKTSLEEITAFNAGSLDVANVGYWHFLRMLDQGFNVKAIAGLASGELQLLCGRKRISRAGLSSGIRHAE